MMKILTGAATVVLLFCLKFIHFLTSTKVSSTVSQHESPWVFQIFSSAKPSYLVVAFAFNIIVASLVLLETFAHFSYSQISATSPTSEIPSFSFPDMYVVHLPPITDEGGNTMNKDDNEHNNSDNEFVPRLVYVEYKELVDGDDDMYGDGLLDDVCYEDDEDGFEEDDNFNKRIEDFIAANNKKWKDELLSEGLFYKRKLSTTSAN